jgi:DNA-binding response OmpR family regulator
VRDGLEVHRDDARAGHLARERGDVVVVHHDRAARVEPGRAGVDHDHVRLVLGDRGADLVAQDRVARDVERRLLRRGQHEPADRCHRVADLADAVLAFRARDQDVAEGRVAMHGPHVGEPVGVQALGVVRLAEERHLAIQQLAGGVVEVVAVQMGHEQRVDAFDDLLRGDRQVAQRVGPRVRRVRHRGARAGGIELRVDQERVPGEDEPQRRGTDQGQLHACRLAQDRHRIRRRFPYAGDTLGAVNGPLICVIEDEEVIASAVAARLRAEGFSVEVAHDGHAGVALCDRVRPDLVVLDLMLPGLDGLEVCRRVQRDRAVPVLMLTARAEESDLLVGLAVGADDYITKPFSPRELVARIRALLRRVERRPSPPGDIVVIGELEIDPAARLVRIAGDVVHLTPTEFDLLALLAARPGVVFSREQLLAEVWGWRDGSGQRTVDSHVRGLRRKLGSDLVRTVHGVGYALEAGR